MRGLFIHHQKDKSNRNHRPQRKRPLTHFSPFHSIHLSFNYSFSTKTTTMPTVLLLLLLFLHLIHPPSTVAQCPYACNSPPTTTGAGNNPTLFPPPSQPGNYNYPPPAGGIYTPPANVFPYNPPTPTFYGGAPPPPDPIVPWFPFYFRDPPRKSSSADLVSGSMAVVLLAHLVMFHQLLLLFLC